MCDVHRDSVSNQHFPDPRPTQQTKCSFSRTACPVLKAASGSFLGEASSWLLHHALHVVFFIHRRPGHPGEDNTGNDSPHLWARSLHKACLISLFYVGVIIFVISPVSRMGGWRQKQLVLGWLNGAPASCPPSPNLLQCIFFPHRTLILAVSHLPSPGEGPTGRSQSLSHVTCYGNSTPQDGAKVLHGNKLDGAPKRPAGAEMKVTKNTQGANPLCGQLKTYSRSSWSKR